MAITPEESGVFNRRPPSPPIGDADAAYLEKLGYKQELNRSLGLFSAFGVQFTSIAIASGIFTTLVVGIGFFGPAAFWSFLVGGALQVFTVGLAVAMLVSSYPLAGGVYQITGRITGKPWLAWQTGWWLLIAHTVAVTACSVSIAPFIAGWFGVTFESAADALPWTLGLIILATVINIAGVKVAALLNNIGVVAECICVFGLIGVLVFFKHPTQPLAFLTDSGGTATGGHWFVPFLFAMILPAYAISSFDATGNASEETKNAALKAPLASVLANVSSYVVGVVMVGMLMLAIQDLPAIMGSALPVKDILDTAVGSAFANVFEAVAIVALFAAVVMLQLTGIRVLWSQARDGQIPAASWMRKVSKQRIPVGPDSHDRAGVGPGLRCRRHRRPLRPAQEEAARTSLALRQIQPGDLRPRDRMVSGAVHPAGLLRPDPRRAGMVMVIGAGAVIYMTIPKSRRGKSIDTQTGHL